VANVCVGAIGVTPTVVEWAVYREGEDWKVSAPVAQVVVSGNYPAEELDEQLAQWGMDRRS
jgi:hypothetical protein